MNTLVRFRQPAWNLFREMDNLSFPLGLFQKMREEADERSAQSEWTPLVDITEKEDAFLLKAELPAMSREDIALKVDNGVLTLSGERGSEAESKESKVHRVERYHGSFLRSFVIPENVDASRVSARYKDGVLEVTLPKVPEAQPSTVKIAVE